MEYSEVGDPEGRTVIHLHGNPGSRYEWLPYDETMKKHGLRVICPDRPGWGLSDFKQGLNLADYPSDIAELADNLGLEKFAVSSLGIGSSYALPVVITMPERVTAFNLVSGFFPNSGQKPPNIVLIKLLTMLMKGKLKNREKFAAWFLQQWPKSDKSKPDIAILKDVKNEPLLQKAIDSVYEGMRHTFSGFFYDLKLVSQPWAFDFKDINPSIPVHLFHGEEDAQVNVSAARDVVAKIPNCTGTYYPGEGTLSVILNKIDEIVDSMQ